MAYFTVVFTVVILKYLYPLPKLLIFCTVIEIADEEETVRNSLDENRLKVKVEK